MPYQDGPFPPRSTPAALPAGQLFFQGFHQVGEMQVKVGQVVGGDDGPVAAIFGVGQEVSQVHGPRQALGGYGEGCHRVQAQKRQVHEVVLGQGARVQVGVDEAQALEAALGAALPGEVGDEQTLGVPHDDVGHHPGPVHQDPHLAVHFPGDVGQLAGQLRGDQFMGGHLAAVEALQPLGLLVLQSGEIAKRPVDNGSFEPFEKRYLGDRARDLRSLPSPQPPSQPAQGIDKAGL